MLTQIKRSGNSFIIRVPRAEMERVGVHADEHVLVDIRPVGLEPGLTPELRRITDKVLASPETARAIARLADA
jgi:antitoxin component of MazEF toxin-antitoxin module